MAQHLVVSDVQVVLAGANYDLQPPAGMDYEVTAIGSSVWVGGVPNGVPQVDVGIFDGNVVGPSHVLRSTDVRGWNREQHLLINNANYLRLNNPGGAVANISVSARVHRSYGAGSSVVMTDVQTVLTTAQINLQPAAGDNWLIRDFGSDQWVGAPPLGIPNVTVEITDGALLTAMLARGIDPRMWDQELELYADNTNFIVITNDALVDAQLSFVAERIRSKGAGATLVTTDVLNCLALASVDFQPPAGHEWEVTGFAAANWVGASPGAFPAITVHIFDATNASMIARQTDVLNQNNKTRIHVDNTDYIRITDTSNLAQDVGISGILTQRYA